MARFVPVRMYIIYSLHCATINKEQKKLEIYNSIYKERKQKERKSTGRPEVICFIYQ